MRNGAGKTTTMRMILGLDAPTQDAVTVGGRSYRDLPALTREVGALLDAKALHGGRLAFDHLLCLTQSNGIPGSRVDEVLRTVGLEGVARRRLKGLSLGMGQRLGIAATLLGTRPCCSSCPGSRRRCRTCGRTRSPSSGRSTPIGENGAHVGRQAAVVANHENCPPGGWAGHLVGGPGVGQAA
jgi:hypothetical protein